MNSINSAKSMFNYKHLKTLLTVEREKNFDQTARALGITASAVSQRINNLECDLGAVVLDRNKTTKLTNFGQALCRHTELVMMLEKTIIKKYKDNFSKYDRENPIIRIFMSETCLSSWFMEVLAVDSECPHPSLFEIRLIDQNCALEEMKSGNALAAICSEKHPIQGFKSVFLGLQSYKATASPKFFDRYFANGVTSDTLKMAPTLRRNLEDKTYKQWISNVFGNEIIQFEHLIPSAHSFVSACRSGIAWAVIPASLVDDDLKNGTLIELVKNTKITEPLYLHFSLAISDSIKEITNLIRSTARKQLLSKKL